MAVENQKKRKCLTVGELEERLRLFLDKSKPIHILTKDGGEELEILDVIFFHGDTEELNNWCYYIEAEYP